MYAILPFCVFIAPPVVGFFADKLGNYIRVLLMSIVGCAFFHSLLLAVPTNLRHVDYPETTMTMADTDVSLKWKTCGAEQACTKIRLVRHHNITALLLQCPCQEPRGEGEGPDPNLLRDGQLHPELSGSRRTDDRPALPGYPRHLREHHLWPDWT